MVSWLLWLALASSTTVSAAPDPATTAPVSSGTAPAPTPSPALAPNLDDCRILVDAGDLDAATDCYHRVAVVDPAHAALALALVDVIGSARLRPPVLASAPAPSPRAAASSSLASPPWPPRLTMEDLAWRGRGELIATAGVTGGAASLLALAVLMSSPPTELVFAAPAFGGLGAAVAATAAVLVFDDLPDGDVHLVRAGLWLGAFEALCVAGMSTQSPVSGQLAAAAALGVGGATAAAAVATAAVVDVADGAPSLGLSFAWIAALGGGLGLAMADLRPTTFEDQQAVMLGTWALLGGAAAVGGVGGVAVGHALDLARPAVWLVDVGAATGALAGLGVALAAGAGTPALGWGATLGGTLLGAGVGLGGARALTVAWRATDPGAAGHPPAAAAGPAARLVPLVVPTAPLGNGAGGGVTPGLGVVVALP